LIEDIKLSVLVFSLPECDRRNQNFIEIALEFCELETQFVCTQTSSLDLKLKSSLEFRTKIDNRKPFSSLCFNYRFRDAWTECDVLQQLGETANDKLHLLDIHACFLLASETSIKSTPAGLAKLKERKAATTFFHSHCQHLFFDTST
jgi:hypothetical protein